MRPMILVRRSQSISQIPFIYLLSKNFNIKMENQNNDFSICDYSSSNKLKIFDISKLNLFDLQTNQNKLTPNKLMALNLLKPSDYPGRINKKWLKPPIINYE